MSKLRKKDKYGAASTTAQPDTDMREQESQEKTAHPAIVPTEIGIAPSITKGKSGVSFHEQHTFQGQGTNPTPPQAKREKRKTKEEGKPKTSSTPPACLSTCPTEVLQSIIGFLRGTKAAHRLDDLLNLRHVNRRFRYLLQPILYESVRIPGQYTSGRSVSKDVRKLLRLIDVNPSLATSIKDVTYYEFPPLEVQEVQYSMKKLKHDFRILSKFVEETGLKDLTGNTLEYILHPSRLHEMSILYENMCIPLLLSRLTNLRILKFGGHVGGGYAFLLTPWAKNIWQYMPLRSLEVLRWQTWDADHAYQSVWWPSHYIYHQNSVNNKGMPPNNDWNVISFLRFAPALKHLTFSEDVFLARATPDSLPVLPCLTSISIGSGPPEETSQCLMQLLICAPILKTLETQACATFRASIFKEALRRVRHTIEEIDLNGEFQCISRTEGAIGSLHDFEKLKKLSTHLAFLSPSSHTGWSESSSLLKLLPPSLESFHIRMTDKDVDRFRSQLTDPQLPFQFQWFSDPIGRLYQLLMNVALAKESGELSELRSISIDDEYSGLSHLSSKEGRRRLAAICATVGLEWRRSKRWD